MRDTPNGRVIERFYHELWNRFDESLVPELMTEDVRFRGSLGPVRNGREGFTEYMRIVRTAFPDFTNRIDDLVSEGDRSFARLHYSGTHRGEVFGIGATGRHVEYEGAALFRFRDGRIREGWVLGDLQHLLRQLTGRADPPAPAPASSPAPGSVPAPEPGHGEHRITFEPEPVPGDRSIVIDGLRAFNTTRIGDYGRRWIDLFVRDGSGNAVGGLLALTVWNWLYVDTVWLPESLRGRGLGSALLAEAESRAKALGCRASFLDTFDFQALPFYERHGYRVFGVQEDFPPGHRHYYLRKDFR
jgi:steroid delta-isomerase-like uncharacterized protein